MLGFIYSKVSIRALLTRLHDHNAISYPTVENWDPDSRSAVYGTASTSAKFWNT